MFSSRRKITSKLWKIIVSTNPYAAIFNQKFSCLAINIFITTAPVPVAQENKQNVIKWTLDAQYKKEQVKLSVKILYMHCVLYNVIFMYQKFI